MSASTTAGPSASVYTTPAFWERLWRTSGLQFVVLFIIASLIYGHQPQVGASPEALDAFYTGDRTRILIAAFFSGLNLLNLLWFTAALRTTLEDVGQEGWGAAANESAPDIDQQRMIFSRLDGRDRDEIRRIPEPIAVIEGRCVLQRRRQGHGANRHRLNAADAIFLLDPLRDTGGGGDDGARVADHRLHAPAESRLVSPRKKLRKIKR